MQFVQISIVILIRRNPKVTIFLGDHHMHPTHCILSAAKRLSKFWLCSKIVHVMAAFSGSKLCQGLESQRVFVGSAFSDNLIFGDARSCD